MEERKKIRELATYLELIVRLDIALDEQQLLRHAERIIKLNKKDIKAYLRSIALPQVASDKQLLDGYVSGVERLLK